MADVNEKGSFWETVSDTTGWRPSLQLTVHIKGDKGAEARDRLLTLCAIYDSAELLRILPTVAEARLKLTPSAEPTSLFDELGLGDTVIGGEVKRLRDAVARLSVDLDDAEAAGDKQIVQLSQRIDALARATESHLRDLEHQQIAMQREIEQLRK